MNTERKGPALAIAAVGLLAIAATIAVNALANILPINGVNTGQLSDELPNLFVPAGFTFSIWGLIYSLLIVHGVAVLLRAAKGGPGFWRPTDAAILLANLAANCGWIVLWHYRQVGWSLLVMLVILGTLTLLTERLHARRPPAGERRGWFAVATPLNVYFGWILVATIANATAWLVSFGWDGAGADTRAWTVAVIAAGLAVAAALAVRRQAVAAPLVVVWAYAGIAAKRLAAPDAGDTVAVWVAALACAAVLVVLVGALALRRRTLKPGAAG